MAFTPGVREEGTIRALAAGAGVPLNVLAGPGVPDVPALGRLGVARVSVGSALMRAAAGAVRRAAADLAAGRYDALLADAPAYADLDALMGGTSALAARRVELGRDA